MDSLVSVIVPIYNVEKYLVQCIESIREQVYSNLQIILVNDGSTDASGEVCEEYREKDGRIEVIHQLNQGLPAARKKGIARACGDYIGFVDGDDYIDSEMYDVLVKTIKSTDVDFVHSGYLIKDCKRYSQHNVLIHLKNRRDVVLREGVFGDNSYISPSVWSKLFKKSLIEKCYTKVSNENGYGEDLLNLCRCVLEAETVMLLDDAFYHYRVRDGSLSRESGIDAIKKEMDLYQALTDLFFEYGIYDDFRYELERFTRRNLFAHISKWTKNAFQFSLYRYPTPQKLRGKNIVLYGGGDVGKSYYAQISRYPNCRILAWVDRAPVESPDVDIEIKSVETIKVLQYDYVLIAIKSEKNVNSARKTLSSLGVETSKILWTPPEMLF